MEIINSLFGGFQMVWNPSALLWIAVGGIMGTLVGALPGLGPSTGVAVLLPLCFALPADQGISLLISVYLGCMYGGRISSILINTPGDAPAIMTCVDGYPLMMKGRGGVAMGISALTSFFGGFVGIIFMTFFTPILADAAMAFGPPEMFFVMVFALIAVGMVTETKSIKGLVMILFGLVLACVGSEYLTGKSRLTFGSPYMLDGIGFVPVAIGLFGFTEVLSGMELPLKDRILKFSIKMKNLFPSLSEVLSVSKVTVLSTIIGLFIGLLPGAGTTLASFAAYGAAKRVSNNKEEFGSGALEGVAAPEAANNACVPGALTPMMALGIPGSAVTAMIMGGFIVHDLQPGPMMFIKSADIAWAIMAALYVSNIILLFINLMMVPVFISIIRWAQPVLYPTVAVLCVIGVYSINLSMFDVIVMFIFGIIGFLFKKGMYPVAGLLLALILGPTIESNFRQAMIISRGSYAIFIASPISIGFLVATLLCLVFPFIKFKKR